MKGSPSFFNFKKLTQSRRGVALITVLILVVLITSVVIGFLITSSLEQTAARSYKASSAARLLSDTAVNLVQGEINEATSQGSTFAWASQPGAIRVFDNTGSLFEIYRLYSAQKLTTTSVSEMDTSTTSAGSNDMPPSTWASSPSVWVDLNAPATDGSGNVHYPILNATQAANVDGFSVNTAAIAGATATSVPMPVTWLYVLQNGEIIPPDAGGTTTATFNNTKLPLPSQSNPIVGRIAFWTDDETCKVNINTAGGDGIETPGTSTTDPNPLPIANATFWDTPRFCAPDDVALAKNQPASGEFQRYPGHPATVALHNILNGLGWTSLTSSGFYGNTTTGANTTGYGLTPRYNLGGSEGGTVAVNAASSIPLTPSPQNRLYSSVAEMLFNYDRTPSVINGSNAITQQQIETAGFFLTAQSRAPEVTLFGQPRISMWPVIDTPTPTFGQVPTPTDKLLAFAATNSGNAYYFTRDDPRSSSADIGLTRNQQLLNYLDHFTSQAIPGYGNSFDSKYTQLGTRQILTEIFDYIRSINIADTTQPLSAAGTNTTEYAQPWIPSGFFSGMYQVAPSVVNAANAPTLAWNTQGFGIFPRLNEAAIQFIAVGRGALPGSPPLIPASPAIPLNSNYTTSLVSSSQSGPLLASGDSGTAPNATTSGTTVSTITNNTTTGQMVPPGNTAAGSTSTMAVQACLLLSFTNPAQMQISNGVTATGGPGANGSIDPYMWVEVSGLDGFKLGTTTPYTLGFPSDSSMIIGNNQSSLLCSADWDEIEFDQMLFERTYNGPTPQTINPFVSNVIPITISPTTGTGTMNFTGGTITVKLYDGSGGFSALPSPSHLIQTYTITFPATSTFNVPTVEIPPFQPAPKAPAVASGPSLGLIETTGTNSIASVSDRWSDGNAVAMANAGTSSETSPNLIYILGDGVGTGDVVQSMVLSPTWSDARLLSISNVPASAFVQDPNWGKQNFAYGFFYNWGPWYSFINTSGETLPAGETAPNGGILYTPGVINPNVTYLSPTTISPYYSGLPVISPTVTATTSPLNPKIADWDTGLGGERDGPWINKADEGVVFAPEATTGSSVLPYFTFLDYEQTPLGASFFSPNREVPSPGMIGSLSTGIDPTGVNPTGWRTLLFRPNPNHFGETSPEDHLMLDLFWMPDTQPYAISEQFSSTGKVNLNYQIQPFTYITRSTALRAVLNPEKIAEVSASQGMVYKLNSTSGGLVGGGMTANARAALDVNQTLTQFQDKFDGTITSGNSLLGGTPDIFHSASQICDMYLVPQGTTVQNFITQWNDGNTYGLVGDNVRERPYTNIYGQLTTKSNTFTVYYTVQSLKNAEPAALQNQWNENQGVVLGEYRGSATMERYIDPNQTIPDFAANPGSATVDGSVATGQSSYYKWRVVESHQFAP